MANQHQGSEHKIGNINFLRKPALLKQLGISSSTLYRLIKSGGFPSPVKLSERISIWRLDEVIIWLEKHDNSR